MLYYYLTNMYTRYLFSIRHKGFVIVSAMRHKWESTNHDDILYSMIAKGQKARIKWAIVNLSKALNKDTGCLRLIVMN